jgi:hypothetical protein
MYLQPSVNLPIFGAYTLTLVVTPEGYRRYVRSKYLSTYCEYTQDPVQICHLGIVRVLLGVLVVARRLKSAPNCPT